MEKEPRNSLSMVGIGIGIGAVTMLILILVGARVTGINLGIVEVGFPTQVVSVPNNPATSIPSATTAVNDTTILPKTTIAPLQIPSTSQPSSGGIAPCKAEELGPWTPIAGKGRDVTIESGESFVHADLWRPGGPQIKPGYDDVSVIIQPGIKVTIPNVAGQAWKYIPGCSREYVESQVARYNQEKQQGGWTITTISLDEFCRLAGCRK
ncbi:hypothetical protein [Roseiflexus sp.]